MLSSIALTSTFVALAASAPLAKRFVQAPTYVFGGSYLSNATFGQFLAKEYAISENSCGLTKFDTDYVVSIKTNHTKLDEVCNMQVNVTNKDNGKWVLATIVDECVTCSYNYLLLSPAAYEKVASSSDSQFSATYTFSNYTAPDTSSSSGQGQAPAPQQQQASSSSAAPAKQSDDSNTDKDSKPSASSSSSSKQWQGQNDESSTSSSKKQQEEQYTSSTSPSKTWAPETTSSTKYYAPETTSSTKWSQTPDAQPETTSSTKWSQTPDAQPTTTSTKQEQAYTPQYTTTKQQQSSYSGGQFSGQATYFYQAGQPGSCGNYNSDSSYVIAVSSAQGGSGSNCGRSIRITNTANGQSATGTVADTCPGCGYGSLDLSVGLFQALGSMDSGVLPITWSWA